MNVVTPVPFVDFNRLYAPLRQALHDTATRVIDGGRYIGGEEVKAFVSWRKGATLTVQDLKDYCLKKMAKYKVPKYIDFVDELPHVSAGKIDRKQLRSKASLTS